MAARRVVAGEQVDAWLEALASASVEPGGGAFAALSAASGSALVEAVARRTLRRGTDATGRLDDIVSEVAGARAVLLALADRDAEAFRATIDAYRIPHHDEEAKNRRLHVLQEALEDAVDVQLDLARRSVYLLGLAEEVTRNGDPNAAADGLSAAAALHAATVAAVANAEINAFAIADAERRAELMETCGLLRDRAGSLLSEAQETFRGRIAVD
jgi:formiminotetrahydrofolate cyclodeaminase